MAWSTSFEEAKNEGLNRAREDFVGFLWSDGDILDGERVHRAVSEVSDVLKDLEPPLIVVMKSIEFVTVSEALRVRDSKPPLSAFEIRFTVQDIWKWVREWLPRLDQ